MADQPTTPSGSRWEQDPDETRVSDTPAAETTAAEPAAETYGVTAPPPPADPAAEEKRAQLRGRAVLAGAATALVLGGGVTGFVIGHSTAGGDHADLRPANFTRQGPGGGQFGSQQGGPSGEGNQLGQQGPPSFDDPDGDGNGPQTSGTGGTAS